MFRTLQSWLVRPTPNHLRRRPRRPSLEVLEDRTTPTVDITNGVATLTGTAGNDQFLIQMKPGDNTTIEFSDNNGQTFTDAAVSSITQINVNGLAGNDTLTLNLANGLIAKSSGNLALAFDGGTGIDRLIVQGNPNATLNETFTPSSTSSGNATLQLAGANATLTTSLTNVTGIQDTATAASLTINGNDNPNVILFGAGPKVNGVQTNVVRSLDLNALAAPDQQGDDNSDDNGDGNGDNGDGNGDNGDDNGDGHGDFQSGGNGDDKHDHTGRAFMSITFANKTSVTVNGLGGDDLFLVTTTTGATGLKNLTLDGGSGFNVLLGNSQLTGVTTTLKNIQAVRTDPLDIFISKLYAERLGRNASDEELGGWVADADRFGTDAVVRGIEESLEGREFLVKGWYRQYLGREASEAEAQAWANDMLDGMTEEQGLQGILGSQEFFEHAQSLFNSGDANQNFIQALYQVLLNRGAGSDEVNGWMQAMSGQDRREVALDFVLSSEFRFDVASSLYDNLLHRGASHAEMNGWAFSGSNLLHMREAFLGSQEFEND